MPRNKLSVSVFALLAIAMFGVSPHASAQTQFGAACSIEGPNNCQLYDGSTERTLSDAGVYRIAADDFVPLGETLTSLCVWGQYIDNDPNAALADCSADAAPDQFTVEIYSSNDHFPSTFWGSVSASSTKTPLGLARQSQGTGSIFVYELTLDQPIPLDPFFAPFWLVVKNDSASASKPHCHWHWSKLFPATAMGNQYSVRGAEYFPWVDSADYAFCMNFDIVPGGAGTIERPCCTCDGTCAITTLADCEQNGGQWHRTETSCTNIPCDAGPPANDECDSLVELPFGGVMYGNQCATTDGPGNVFTELGPTPLGNDLWFSYHSDTTCVLMFEGCESSFDSVISVYFNPDDPDVCPCPADPDFDSYLVGAADENCANGSAVGAGGVIGFSDECIRGVGCFTIRIAGYNGARGNGLLYANCAPVPADQPSQSRGPIPPPTPVADPMASNKSRFISMTIPVIEIPCEGPFTPEVAIRVKLSSLHHVVPPYSGSPSIPFSAFEGQVRWVGPPTQYLESSSSGIPFYAAALQCSPHYRDWGTLGLFHVTGSAIVPSSTYLVEVVSSVCEGVEDSFSCTFGGANVSGQTQFKTTRWCDLESAFNPPSTTSQPDLGDVSALVNKFRNAPGAPIKARCLLIGNDLFGNFSSATMSVDLNFSHIAAAVDAFRGRGYPHEISACQ